MEKTKIMVLNENLRASSDACAAQATVTAATTMVASNNNMRRVKPYIAVVNCKGHSSPLMM